MTIRGGIVAVVTLSAATIAVAGASAFAAGHPAAPKEYFQLAGIGTKSVFIAH